MDLLVSVGHFVEPSKGNPQDSKISVKGLRDKGNLMKNSMKSSNICDMCGLVFSSKQNLLKHLRVYSTHNSVCKECGRTLEEPWCVIYVFIQVRNRLVVMSVGNHSNIRSL
ncbi:hypothetical protein AVEN_254700-1 [Araneus ventricosus]|uniref:C2H2-type domain-containing protein n=1 Tax=Araneus ventricosus TaxID=182803 RepID=A0A4Y2UJQ1_ARAVE|nr:hypothetical protein AVEN_254700-1 [Araneus ventricosus]